MAGLAFGESSLDKIIYNLVTGAALGALSGPITSISKVVASRITSKVGLSLIIKIGGAAFGKAVLETSVTLAKWKLIQGRNPTWGQALQLLGVNFILSGILESMGTGFDRLGELGKDVKGRLDDIYNTIASGHLPNGFHQMTLEARKRLITNMGLWGTVYEGVAKWYEVTWSNLAFSFIGEFSQNMLEEEIAQ